MNQLTRREFLKIFTLTGVAGSIPNMTRQEAPLTLEKRVGQLEIKVDGLERGRSYVYSSLGNLRNDVYDLKLKTARTPFYEYRGEQKNGIT